MSEGSKLVTSAAAAPVAAGLTLRFLPVVDLPANLPADPSEHPIAIADMANAFGVTHRTLHFYEEKGLISAGRIGPMRIYGHDSIVQMAVINTCREVGMPIAVIQELMEELDGAVSQDEADAIFHNALAIRKRELVSSLSTIHRQMQKVIGLLDGDAIRVDLGPGINDNRQPAFSDAERHCLELMAEAQGPGRIAQAMGMEVEAVQAMENAIIAKFSANNRFQAVAKAALLGLVKS